MLNNIKKSISNSKMIKVCLLFLAAFSTYNLADTPTKFTLDMQITYLLVLSSGNDLLFIEEIMFYSSIESTITKRKIFFVSRKTNYRCISMSVYIFACYENNVNG